MSHKPDFSFQVLPRDVCNHVEEIREKSMLVEELLLLSTQSVISLSLKTLLKHAGFTLFLLNPARFLSVKSFCMLGFLC